MEMATTDKNNKDFVATVIGDGALDSAIDWIGGNLSPDDVFSSDDLRRYCRGNEDPDDVFSEKQLADWAEANGFTKDED
jgi:hypothetical protein